MLLALLKTIVNPISMPDSTEVLTLSCSRFTERFGRTHTHKKKGGKFEVHKQNITIYVTGFVKTGLIAGVRNCSYSPFSSAKSNFFDFVSSQKYNI